MSLAFYLLAIIIALVSYLYFKLKKRLSYWQNLGIACDEPNLLLGNVAGFQTERPLSDMWLQYYEKYKGTGPFAGFYWFQRPAAFILDTALMKNILIKDFSKFTDRNFFSNEESDPLTGQLFLLKGNKWRNMRNKLSPAFTSGKMKLMFPTVVNIAETLIDVLGESLLQEKTDIVEIKDWMSRFTIDVIGTCAFGIDCNSLHNPQEQFRIMGRRSLTEFRNGLLGAAFTSSYPDFAAKINYKHTAAAIEEFFLGIVRETIDLREKNNIRRNDFLDMLIDLKNNKLMKTADGDGEMTNLTFNQVAAQAFVFLVAGFETSSTTMGFVLYELARNQDVQQKVRAEIEQVLEKHEQQFTYECMNELQYLEQVLSETLRLYTVLPIINRLCLEDYVVPGHANFVIKKNMPIMIPANAIHRDPEFYANPDVFNPDNFSPEAVKQRDSILYLPFGEGPRNCIGMRFGLMQARVGLVFLLKNFNFSICEQTQIPLLLDKRSFLISTQDGIYLKVEKL